MTISSAVNAISATAVNRAAGLVTERFGGFGPTSLTLSSAGEAVEDYSLQGRAGEILLPVLGTLGFELKREPFSSRSLEINCCYTSLKQNGLSRALIQFPTGMMDRPNRTERATLVSLFPEVLGRGADAIVFSEDVDAPLLAARRIILDGWARAGIRSAYVPWRDVIQVDGERDESERKYLIFEMLGLTCAPGGGGGLMLEQSEIRELVRILSGMSYLDDLRSQDALLFQAGLADLRNVLNLQKDRVIVASQWIQVLLQKGELPDRRGVQALGAVLEVVRDDKGLSIADRECVVAIIKRYKLLPA